MTTTRKTLTLALVAGLLIPALPTLAQDDSGFSGSILVGFRTVDVSGADRKFKEDINLDDGPRLFDLSFDFVPEDGQASFADRLELDISNAGGDPFETLRLDVQKFGSYDFSYKRTKSEYFYDDLLVPPTQFDIEGAVAGDFHTFDFERVREEARLDLELTPQATLTFGFDRYTKKGESTTTLDISRDEFELDRPIDESLNDYIAGFEYSWDKVTLILEERVRDYENLVEIFLPGFSLGETVDDLTTLDFFFLDQPYDFTSFDHTVRLLARPNDRLRIRFGGTIQDLDLDVDATEESQGVSFQGNPFTTNLAGSGDIERDVELFDVEVDYRLTDRLTLIASVRQNNLDQDGQFLFGADNNVGAWEIETLGAEAGLEFFVSPTVTVSGGLVYEDRDVDFAFDQDGVLPPEDEELDEGSTDHDGYYGIVSWRPSSAFLLHVSFEDNSFDDPFTLASATDRQRYRVRGRYRWDTGLSLTGTYLVNDYENTNSGWDAENNIASFRLGYEEEGLYASLGYSFVDVERSIDQVVEGGFREDLFRIFYEADSDFLNGQLRYQVNDRVAFGGLFRLYDNDGSFALERDDLRAYVEVGFLENYLFHLGYRTVDYDEQAFNIDDYDADIAEFSIGYRW